jgi:hypothetical protein
MIKDDKEILMRTSRTLALIPLLVLLGACREPEVRFEEQDMTSPDMKQEDMSTADMQTPPGGDMDEDVDMGTGDMGGEETDMAMACEPSEEVCNGVDDDCDDSTDEDISPRDCDRQVGVCAGATRACEGDQQAFEAACTDADYAAHAAAQDAFYTAEDDELWRCDGVDNDCDDNVDEGCCAPGADAITHVLEQGGANIDSFGANLLEEEDGFIAAWARSSKQGDGLEVVVANLDQNGQPTGARWTQEIEPRGSDEAGTTLESSPGILGGIFRDASGKIWFTTAVNNVIGAGSAPARCAGAQAFCVDTLLLEIPGKAERAAQMSGEVAYLGERWTTRDDIDPIILTRIFTLGERAVITTFTDDFLGSVQWCISDDPLAECDTLTRPQTEEELSPYAFSQVDMHDWAPKPDGSGLTFVWFDESVPGLFQLSLDEQGVIQDKGQLPFALPEGDEYDFTWIDNERLLVTTVRSEANDAVAIDMRLHVWGEDGSADVTATYRPMLTASGFPAPFVSPRDLDADGQVDAVNFIIALDDVAHTATLPLDDALTELVPMRALSAATLIPVDIFNGKGIVISGVSEGINNADEPSYQTTLLSAEGHPYCPMN